MGREFVKFDLSSMQTSGYVGLIQIKTVCQTAFGIKSPVK